MAQQLKRYFVGFSTQNSDQTGVRQYYDIDLINVDLMASFQTRVGERVMRPDFGCHLWDYLMEPLTPGMRDTITSEAVRVCQLDSRLIVNDVQVTEIAGGFIVNITLTYLPWNVISTFTANFERSDAQYYGLT